MLQKITLNASYSPLTQQNAAPQANCISTCIADFCKKARNIINQLPCSQTNANNAENILESYVNKGNGAVQLHAVNNSQASLAETPEDRIATVLRDAEAQALARYEQHRQQQADARWTQVANSIERRVNPPKPLELQQMGTVVQAPSAENMA